MAVVTATQTLDPSARRDDDSQTQRRDFLSICYSLQSLPTGRTFFHWSCYELWTSSGQCPSTPHNLWSKHPICTRTRTPVAQVPYLFPRVATRVSCVLTGGCNTARRWHFRNLLNNSKSVTWKPYLRTSQVMTYKKYIYWEINLFLQVNVFVKHQSKALLTVLSNSVSWRTCIHSQEYQR